MITYPIGSMHGIFTIIWLIFIVKVGKYTIYIRILWDIASRIEVHMKS